MCYADWAEICERQKAGVNECKEGLKVDAEYSDRTAERQSDVFAKKLEGALIGLPYSHGVQWGTFRIYWGFTPR